MNHETVEAFIQRHTPLTQKHTVWGNGTIPLRVSSYLSQELPPLDLVTSVRAVVMQEENVLAVLDPNSKHYILPGGRREAGETLLQTLRREILEETGWTLTDEISQLGFLHFYHLGPKPVDYAYVYPNFFQVIYAAHAQSYMPEAKQFDEYVLNSFFHPTAKIAELILVSSVDLVYLDAILKKSEVNP